MKWIEMMVKKLTARYMNLNKQFKVQRHTIVCQSGMEDYVSVTIDLQIDNPNPVPCA